jgi:hypothetical protein
VRPCFLTVLRFAEARLRSEPAGSISWSFRRLGTTRLAGVAGLRFALPGQPSVRRGAAVKLQSEVNSWPFRRPGADVGDARAAGSRLPTREWTSFGSSPAVLRGLEELETAPLTKRTRVQTGPLASHGAVELARPIRARQVACEPSGPHRLRSLTDRAQNPMGACRVKQTDEVPGGANRQEGAKPWRRKGCRSGKPAVGVLQTATCRQARTLKKGLPVLMAPKGQKTS